MAAPVRRVKPGAGIAVEVGDRQRLLRVSSARLVGLVRRALACEGVERAEIGILLVDDRQMAMLHERWLGIPGPTDVITFDLSPAAVVPGPRLLAGDIAASTETARRAAWEVGWTPRQELAYYLIHGLLHLTGHDDRAPADRRAMRARERVVLRACGLPAPPRKQKR